MAKPPARVQIDFGVQQPPPVEALTEISKPVGAQSQHFTQHNEHCRTMPQPEMIWQSKRVFAATLWGCLCAGWLCSTASAQSRLNEAPIRYLDSKGQNRITELIDKIDSGEIDLKYRQADGYLRSILEALEVPISSQSLVFSKTSLQSGRISPSNPRAIFFGDDVYVGWVNGSSLLELSVADPSLGAVYYSMRMTPGRPYVRRENNSCLGCHEKTVDHGKIPVHTIQSVSARESGKINLLLNSFVTDHTSPFHERWGGWYVTGDHGTMQHSGNSFLVDEELVSQGPSVASTLVNHFDLSRWPVASSDIVALMVMEHQTEMQNRLTDANYAVRRAHSVSQDSQSGDPKTVESVIDKSAKLVVDYLLFNGEARLDAEIKCSNSFTQDFTAKGPTTTTGKSLRQFDLKSRLFRYPCSYVIYSQAFAGLDPQLRERVYLRLWRVLTRRDLSPEYDHLSSDDRSSILEILQQTKPDLPDFWTTSNADPQATIPPL